MKNTLTVILAPYLLLFLFSSCAKQTQAPSLEPVTVQETASVQPEVAVKVTDVIGDLGKPESLAQRFSYTYGYMLYSAMVQQQAFNELDSSYIAKGVLDAASGSGFFSQEEMNQILYEVQAQLLKIAQQEMEILAEQNLKTAEEFLATNKTREGVQATASGLQYQVLKEGEGEQPRDESIVEVDYQIFLLSGKVIDSSYERGQSSSFQLNAISVPGFIEGVKLMHAGSQYRFWIHPNLGYGKDGNQAIDPNVLLIVEVELKSVNEGL